MHSLFRPASQVLSGTRTVGEALTAVSFLQYAGRVTGKASLPNSSPNLWPLNVDLQIITAKKLAFKNWACHFSTPSPVQENQIVSGREGEVMEQGH